MCVICRNEFIGLKNINCANCPELKQIPQIPELKTLNCSNCPKLEQIFPISGLEALYCSECPELKQIPMIPGLKYLNCARCSSLTEIPWINNLMYLFCEESRLLIHVPPIPSLTLIFDTECVWMKPRKTHYDYDYYNDVYIQRIQKLKVLQKWFRKISMRRKLLNLIPVLMPLYYHPDFKGGYFHQKELFDYVYGIGQNKRVE